MNYFKLDTHMHFDLYRDRIAVMDYLEKQKSYTIAMTNLPDIYSRYIGIDKEYKYVKIALGFHPELAYQYHNQLAVFKRLATLTRYIGEVGLDYKTIDPANRKAQRQVLYTILEECEVASDRKIISIHSRKAEADVISALKGVKKSRIIMHWYSGSLRDLDKALEIGCYFSINHAMVKSTNGRSVIDAIPTDRILIESDAPFTQGMRNTYDVSFMEEVYLYLTRIKMIQDDKLSALIKDNFRNILS